MFSKRKGYIVLIAFGVIFLLLATNITTFVLSNRLQIKNGDKVVISVKQYNELVSRYNQYEKPEFLKEIINENYLKDVSEEELNAGVIKGMFEALDDPYSVYMTEEEFEDFMDYTEGSYGGIGVIVTPGEDNLITVVSPIEDTPGERAGIKTGDKIVKVNGQEFTADQMDDAVDVMKGTPGTEVLLTILRKGEDNNREFIDVPIIREEIRLKTVKSQMLENKIGYIRITSFDKKTDEDFKKHLGDLKKQGMQGLIIDLRNNPGGLLSTCVEITDELMGKGTIVYTETKQKERNVWESDSNKLDMPLAILINDGSASASEILSGAMKDTKTGILIGTKTFGKGIVQTIKGLQDGSGYKLTTSEYFTPNGINIHGIGIKPDIYVELPEEVVRYGVDNIDEDVQLQKAIEVIINQLD